MLCVIFWYKFLILSFNDSPIIDLFLLTVSLKTLFSTKTATAKTVYPHFSL